MSRHPPKGLKPDDEGVKLDDPYGIEARSQDVAFQVAMQKAIAAGKETAQPGVKVETDIRVIRRVSAPTFVPSASAISDA